VFCMYLPEPFRWRSASDTLAVMEMGMGMEDPGGR
jgi:hypothetical protein